MSDAGSEKEVMREEKESPKRGGEHPVHPGGKHLLPHRHPPGLAAVHISYPSHNLLPGGDAWSLTERQGHI